MPRVPHQKNDPQLTSEQVLNIPIKRILATHDGSEGAYYETLGVELESGDILSLCCPYEDYEISPKTREVRLLHDLTCDSVSVKSYVGLTLKNLIYYKVDVGDNVANHYLAVLDNGAYITSYVAFNYNEFAFAKFDDWNEGGVSRASIVADNLKKKIFFNAWSHTRIDPFRLY